MPASSPWLFEDLSPGHHFGATEIALDASRLSLWSEIFGETTDEAALPCGVLVAAMMQGYLELLHPRPPGNIHASQSLRFAGATVRAGDVVTVGVECRDKYVKKDRRWVVFAATVSKGGTEMMRGDITTIWAK